MPYMQVGNCIHKQNSDGSAGETVPGGCHDTPEEAKKHMQALYANVNNSSVVEMSLRITKAAYNKSDRTPMKWAAIDSDVDEDLYQEKMSLELYKDFVSRIENKTPIPEPFAEVICEQDWCGGTPYLSIAHYKAGTGKLNVPGDVESVFIDGTRLKSKGTLHDSPLGRKVFDALREDLYMEKSGNQEHLPVRISIGFLDLEHKHQGQGTEFTFVRKNVGEICPLCAQGIGGKIYTKGQLVHLAMTRVPVNPRTQMSVERSMDEITSKRKDAESIVGELAETLEEKSIASGMLVVRAEDGSMPVPDENYLDLCDECYDPNTDSFDQACVSQIMSKFVGDTEKYVQTVKSMSIDEVIGKAKKRKDVSSADKKRAEKKYGDVTYADETNKKYPIDTEEHVRAALSYWGMPKNRDKYSPEDQKKIGGRIHAAAKKFGITVTDKKSVVEDAMTDEIKEVKEESVLGIPEKPFEYAGISGDGKNNLPNPVKAKQDEEAGEGDKAGDEEKEMEKSFAALRAAVVKAKTQGLTPEQYTAEINKAFADLGTSVENAFKPKSNVSGLDAQTLAEIVRSAVQAEIQPLRLEVATLKAQVGKGATVSAEQVVKSKALTLNGYPRPEDMIQRALPEQPQRKLSQIEQIALKSTGAIR